MEGRKKPMRDNASFIQHVHSKCGMYIVRMYMVNPGNGGVIDRMTGQYELFSLKIATRSTRAPCHPLSIIYT